MSREMNILTFLVMLAIVTADNGREKFFGNPDSIVYPEPIPSRKVQQRAPARISVSLARTLSSINSVEEFLSLVKGVPETQKNYNVESRFGVERSNAIRPAPARCIPELQIVSLVPNDTDGSMIYFPSCARVQRCGGCCEHAVLSCQPTEKITENYEIRVAQLDDINGMVDRGIKIVPVEVHTQCRCQCTMKNEHCHDREVYSEERCECECTNSDEEEKCRGNPLKRWDFDTCTCHCLHKEDCQTKFYFNPESCRCEAMSFYSWAVNRRTESYGSRQASQRDLPSLVPLDTDNRRRINKDDPEYK